ncbi:hypothetical protein [uncultured Desulfovibrio sp.]|uniref:hypothetical protein n=1 Tax=uncultured Desulfovibrio sp. TaxID=167968 RepID=UPI0028042D54|nr:hypothetical protein [uncultured Desulfovibrio sp.]
MKRHYEDNGALELDVLYESEDPAVQAALVEFMQEEMAAAQERATIRFARRFRHLLSPVMQARLDRQYPAHGLAATA